MSTNQPDFPSLLAGATPGPWYAVKNPYFYELNVEDSETAKTIAAFCASKCCFGETVEKTNTEYVARCNPSVMRVVWEALEGANQALEDLKRNLPGTYDGYARATHEQIKSAIRALNGEPTQGEP